MIDTTGIASAKQLAGRILDRDVDQLDPAAPLRTAFTELGKWSGSARTGRCACRPAGRSGHAAGVGDLADDAAVAAGRDVAAGPRVDLGDLARREELLLLDHHHAAAVAALLVRPDAATR